MKTAITFIVRKLFKWGFIVGTAAVVGFVLINAGSIRTCVNLDLNSAYASRLPVTMTDASDETRTLLGEPWLKLDEVPKEFLTALVASEDKRFWTRDWGVDGRAVLRAVYNLMRGRTQGGSTLQMQTARSGFDLPGGNFDRSLKRKVFEAIVAVRLSKDFTREQILEIYLNTANIAGETGLRAAARKHFNCTPRRLTGPQCLWLVSTLPRPTERGKEANTVKALERTQTTAQKCVENAGCEFADIGLRHREQTLKFTKGRPVMNVPVALFSEVKRTFSAESWKIVRQTGGGNVELTIDLDLQYELQETLTTVMASLASRLLPSAPGELKAALVVLDAETGAILACISSRNAADEYSFANQAKREPGSTVKTFEMAAALESATVRLDTLVTDAPLAPGSLRKMPLWRRWPANADGRYLGEMTLAEAFARSRNPVFVKLGDAHRGALDTMLRSMNIGFVEPDAPAQFIVGQTMTLMELTAAYAAIANDGVWHKPYLVSRVLAPNGEATYSVKAEVKRVMTGGTADDVYAAMRGVMDFGTAQSLRWLPGVGKTGTTSADGGGRSRDLRFQYLERGSGVRRSISVGLWVGANTGAIERRAIPGTRRCR